MAGLTYGKTSSSGRRSSTWRFKSGGVGTGWSWRMRGAADAGGPQVLGRHHHLLRGLDQQPREPDQVRAVLAVGLDEVLGRHLDAQVDDAEAVVAEDDLDQVLADVVHVALDGGEHDRPLV